MKKIFGILSLIAMLTVAFSTKAIASDADKVSTEFVATMDVPVIDVVASVSTPSLVGWLNVADVSVSYTANREVVDSTDIASRVFYSTTSNSYAKVFLPIEVGLSTVNSNSDASKNIETITPYTDYTNGYEVPEIVGRISANVGKLTDFSRSI